MDDFDNILKQLLGKLPEHSPKSDVWDKISGKLDEDLSMSRLRRILKNNERAPKTDLWPAIESVLVGSLFWKTLLRSAWVKYVLPSVLLVSTLIFIKPFSNTQQELVYNKPLNRDVNAGEIVSAYHKTPEKQVKQTMVNPVAADQKDLNNVTVNTTGMSDLKKDQNNVVALSAINNEEIQHPENIMNTETNNISYQDANDENVLSNNINVDQVTPLSLLMIEDKWTLKDPLISKLNVQQLNNTDVNKGLGHPDFSLEFSYSPEMSFMDLKNNNDDYNIDLKKRKQAEQLSYSNTMGVEGKIDLRHWFFQSGVNYSEITTSSRYAYKFSGLDTVGWHLDTVFVYLWIDTLGYCHDSLIYSWSPLVDEVSHNNLKVPAYQIRYIQIPLIAGYSVTRGKLQYNIAGGLALGIPLSISGRMIEPDNYTISGVEDQSLSLRKIVYSGILRAGVNYFISPHYSVFAQPSLRYTINSVFDKNYPVSQKYLTCGLRLGVSYRF